jgi:amphi-Trp domain-containing protein
MRQGKSSFRHESLQDGDSIKAMLKAISDGIKKGKVVISDEDEKIVLNPEGLLHLRLKASQEEGQHQISIRISWQVEDEKPKKRRVLSVGS